MKHVFSIVAAVMLASAAWAQTTVTLTVDMSNETVSPDGVHVAGNFQGWSPGATPMIDNGDGTWSHTFTSDTSATYQYKFINGNTWGLDEGIPSDCAVDNNRQIEVDGMMGSISSSACFNSCNACGVTTVLFRVDMSNEDVSPFGVHILGDFNEFDPAASPMTDADGDMIFEYSHTFDASVSTVSYTYLNGNTLVDTFELVEGECANDQGIRELVLDSDNIILSANAAGDAYCFNQCTSCILPLQVTFTVDMSVVSSVDEQGVHIAGTFQGWDAESTMLSDNGDGTWSTTLEVAPGPHEFKFINGAGWNGGEENMNGTSCNASGNRGAEFDADNDTYTACFNICPGESCLPDPNPANLTFQVDATDVDLGGESMFIFGAFTGWQGGAIPMTDNGDGTWQTTQLVSGSANVDYKYSIGAPSEGNDESGSYVLAGDSTTFEMEGCGVENGFGGYNRRFVRSGTDEVIPLHCYNSCGACLGDLGCTNSTACNYDPTAVTDDGSCLYPGDACDDMDDLTFMDMYNDTCACVGVLIEMGCMDTLACNYDMDANMDDGSCLIIGNSCDDMDEITVNDVVDSTCVCIGEATVLGCTDTLACNYDPAANVDDDSCLSLDALDVCGGNCFEADTVNGGCLVEIMLGCTDTLACNYDMDANTDDGSCLVIGDSCDDMDEMTINDMVNDSCVCVGEPILMGCTDTLACNYNMDANEDDGSCLVIGESCDDMDVNTINDMINDSCVCAGEDTTTFVFEFERLEFGMFPNPTTGEVTLRVEGFHAGVTMQVMDGAGRVVWSEQNLALQGNRVFDLSRLTAGTYNVMLSDERGISVKRLVIQK